MDHVAQGRLPGASRGRRRAIEAAGHKALADNRVVDVNVIEIEETESGPRPYRLRERIRADGPTIDYAPASAARVSQAA
jgi:hypothetical protein